MSLALGIFLAFVAMLCWGFGDFLIQKSTRKFGDWNTLFIISGIGAIVLFPFISKDLPSLMEDNRSLLLLGASSLVLLFASILDFEALKEGKIAVVEPIWSLEITVAIIFSVIILNEQLSLTQYALIGAIVVGLFCVSLRSKQINKKVWLEKGVIVALIAAAFMGLANFMTGFSARETNPLLTIWFLHGGIAIASFLVIVAKGYTKNLVKSFKKGKKLILSMSILDNSAWIAFAFAMTLAPISITVALSESYIIIAVLLGMYVNKEFLRKHQKIGLIIAVISAISLAAITI